jgi:hypothetical protein
MGEADEFEDLWFRFGPLKGVVYPGGGWVRIFGYLIMLKNPSSKPLFSERYGYAKPALKLFGYRLFLGEYGSRDDAPPLQRKDAAE